MDSGGGLEGDAHRQVGTVARFTGYSLYFISNRAPHLTQFGHLKHSAEYSCSDCPGCRVRRLPELALLGRMSEPLSHAGR